MYKITINKFYGGIANDVFSADAASYANALGLDDLLQAGRLSPYRSYTSRILGATNIRRVVMGSDSTIYALGEASGASTSMTASYKAAVHDTSWTLSATGTQAPRSKAFTDYKDHIYAWNLGETNINRYVKKDAVWHNEWQTIGNGNAGPIYSHSDGILYTAYGNIIASWDGTTWTAAALTIPAEYQIVDITDWGQNLVTGAAWGNGVLSTFNPSKSRVFFWDTINTSTYQMAKNIPEGIIIACRNIGEEIAVIALSVGADISQDATLLAYTYNGGQFILRKKIIVQQETNSSGFGFVDQHIQVKNNQIYFIANVGGVKGVWRFGKNNGVYCLKRDRLLVNAADDTDWEPITSTASIGFIGDYLCSITAVGTLACLINANTYSATGIYESAIFGAGKQYESKNLLSVAIATKVLPASASVLVRYRVDGTTAWTDIGTHSSGVFSEFADELQKDWNQIQFRLETTGNAEITEFTFLYESMLNIML